LGLERSVNLRDLNEDLDFAIHRLDESQGKYHDASEVVDDLKIDLSVSEGGLNDRLGAIRDQISEDQNNDRIETLIDHIYYFQSDIKNDPDYKIVPQVEHDQRWWERANAVSGLSLFMSGTYLLLTTLGYFVRRISPISQNTTRQAR
jgi:hypothetical protein